MVLPGSMNIAPPPVQRRTTVIPSFCATAVLTSSSSDWNLPMTTAGAAHSQIRSVGSRLPAATSRAHAMSVSICSFGSRGLSWMTVGFRARQRSRYSSCVSALCIPGCSSEYCFVDRAIFPLPVASSALRDSLLVIARRKAMAMPSAVIPTNRTFG